MTDVACAKEPAGDTGHGPIGLPRNPAGLVAFV
jgi:hypothetical protein